MIVDETYFTECLDIDYDGTVNLIAKISLDSEISEISGFPDAVKSLEIRNLPRARLVCFPSALVTLRCVGFEGGIDWLPDLPETLESVDVSYNSLTWIPKLPKALKTLRAYFNDLTSLPELPASLEILSVHNNNLTQLPDLPKTLKVLKIGKNLLTRVPELPETLDSLDIGDNDIFRLPDLPKRLRGLYCDNCRLDRLPDLPETLVELSFSYNNITRLPDLPKTLKSVFNLQKRIWVDDPLPDLVPLKRIPMLSDSLRCVDIYFSIFQTCYYLSKVKELKKMWLFQERTLALLVSLQTRKVPVDLIILVIEALGLPAC